MAKWKSRTVTSDASRSEADQHGPQRRNGPSSSRLAVVESWRSDLRTEHRPGVWRAVGGLEIAEFVENDALSPSDADAHPSCRIDAWRLILQLEGRSVLTHGGTTFRLETGDLILVEGGTPPRRCGSEQSRMIVVHLPRPLLQARLPTRSPAPPCVIDGRDGIAMMLGKMAYSMLLSAAPFYKREEAGVRDAIVHLVTAAYCARRDTCRDHDLASGAKHQQLRGAFTRNWLSLQRSIEALLTDPSLSPATVAAMNRMSTRHLHRLLKQAGTSFTAYVRTRRLEQCRDDLADPTLGKLPLTEIAYRWGFNDSSHFSRCFKAAFGCTAREFRARETGARPLPVQNRDNALCAASETFAADVHKRDRSPFAEDGA